MKKVYIVKRGDVILQISTNLKAAYGCLEANISKMDSNYMRSYMQLTRIFKKQNYFNVPSDSGPKWEITRLPVVSYFVK